MRLTKFLSLYVNMSRNQAKFYIRKGRASVDGVVIRESDFELSEDSRVMLDGNLIESVEYRYFLLNKPISYECVKQSATAKSICKLLPQELSGREVYFANILRPIDTGLVVISDNPRWSSMLRKKMSKKSRVYYFTLAEKVSGDQVSGLRASFEKLFGSSKNSAFDIQHRGDNLLELSSVQARISNILSLFESMNFGIEVVHLQRVGKLDLGDLRLGESKEFTEGEITL